MFRSVQQFVVSLYMSEIPRPLNDAYLVQLSDCVERGREREEREGDFAFFGLSKFHNYVEKQTPLKFAFSCNTLTHHILLRKRQLHFSD